MAAGGPPPPDQGEPKGALAEAETTVEENPLLSARPAARRPKLTVAESQGPGVAPRQPLEGPGPSWPSVLPTQKPGDKPSPFAGLLAEAGAKDDESTLPGSAEAKAEPRTKRRRIGPYEVVSELGSGGMAVVHKGLQPSLERIVAIKELRREYLNDKQLLLRFEREASSLANLQHANIVHIYDFIRDSDGAYIVMEFVDGIDLFDLLVDVKRLPIDVAALVALQLAEGLEYAHYRGIVHRDVKPSNILISRSGEVKIMDFGIARDQEQAHLTQVGMAIGTPAYMAPEQIAGEETDFRSDVFGLGIVFYELLTGTKPWGSDEDTRGLTRRVLYEDPTPASDHRPEVPREIDRIILRCLAKEPGDRYPSTYELRRDLERWVARELALDARQRLVVFLRNRGILSEADAGRFVGKDLLADRRLRALDLGLPRPEIRELMRPLLFAGGVTLALILSAAVLNAVVDYGTRLPSQRPKLTVAP